MRLADVLGVDLTRSGVRVPGDALLLDHVVAVGGGGHAEDLHAVHIVHNVVLRQAPQQRVRDQAVPRLTAAAGVYRRWEIREQAPYLCPPLDASS